MNSSQPPVETYLWAVGEKAAQIPPGTLIANRYEVVSEQLWRDTLSTNLPDAPSELSALALPYLHLFPYRLHVPEIYGICLDRHSPEPIEVLLLENIPVTAKGELYPTLQERWTQATAIRQVYWLWQILELWSPLVKQGVASSLLVSQNIRVQSWRVWLRELISDPVEGLETAPLSALDLRDLGQHWEVWVGDAQPEIRQRLQEICGMMQEPDTDMLRVAPVLNQLLLELAAQVPLRWEVAGASETGPRRSHNEDSCYPLTVFPPEMTVPDEDNIPDLAIVCDGIGGHEGGEVASQLAVRSLKLQIQGLLTEMAEQTEPVLPNVLQDHLQSVIRIVNNVIAAQNDAQGRELRQRMGTTLVMALQINQKMTWKRPNSEESENELESWDIGIARELYLAHVGDSRAYWITPDYCQCLTVDDDVAVREVRLGRSTYREALRRPDGGALTQALGTRDAEYLHPNVQRLIIDEEGVLLLCSDGLSDRNRIENSWAEYTSMFFDGNMSLDEAVQAWVELANEKNGHDNTSVVLVHCRVSPEAPVSAEATQLDASALVRAGTINAALTSDDEAPIVLATPASDPKTPASGQSPADSDATKAKPLHRQGLSVIIGLLALLLVGTTLGLVFWQQTYPDSFRQFREQLGWPQSPTP